MKRYIVLCLMALVFAQWAMAQSGTNSPYSQFGLGELSDQTSGFNRGMSGLGLGFHEHNQVNFKNPASYSSIDSLSFIFDAGFSGQVTNFKEGNTKLNANNADFEYVVAGLRLFRHLGMSFGLLPFTNIGYSYSMSQDVDDADNTTATTSYSGTGGLHQIYLGIGWEPFKGFAIGVNGAYLFGDYTKLAVNQYSSSYANSLTKRYTGDVHNYRVNFGLQYTTKLSKKDELTLGATYEYGHKIGGHPKLEIVSSNSQTGTADTTSYGSSGMKLAIPHIYAAGFMYNHANKLKVGVDYEFQKWSSVDQPVYSVNSDEQAAYALSSSYYKDRHKVTVGADYCPREMGLHFLQRVHYRAGVSYATPYYYIDGNDGPKELSASIGVGIPIVSRWNNRTILNIGGQWVHRSADHFITENTFRINIGLTFNERWFDKWKLQ